MVSLLMLIVAQRSSEEGELQKYIFRCQRSHSNKLFRYAKYVRERGEVEREYARALRKLVARWDNLFVC